MFSSAGTNEQFRERKRRSEYVNKQIGDNVVPERVQEIAPYCATIARISRLHCEVYFSETVVFTIDLLDGAFREKTSEPYTKIWQSFPTKR